MKQLRIIGILAVLLISFSCESTKTSALEDLINEYQNHKGYERSEYPLGLFTIDYYKAEAAFASGILDRLKAIDSNSLSETDQISLALLSFNVRILLIIMTLSVF